MTRQRPATAGPRRRDAPPAAGAIGRRSAYDDFNPPAEGAEADLAALQEQMLLRDKRRLEAALQAERKLVASLRAEVQGLTARSRELAAELGEARGTAATREFAAKQERLRSEAAKVRGEGAPEHQEAEQEEGGAEAGPGKVPQDVWEFEVGRALKAACLSGGAEVVGVVLGMLERMLCPQQCADRVRGWLRRGEAARQRALQPAQRFGGRSAASAFSGGCVPLSAGALLPVTELIGKYRGGDSMRATLQTLGNWRTVQGPCWEEGEVTDLVHDCEVLTARHCGGRSPAVAAPLFFYTSETCQRIVWAVWVPAEGVWAALPLGASAAQEAEHAKRVSEGDTLVLAQQARTAAAWLTRRAADNVPAAVAGTGPPRQGVSGFGEHDFFVARYCNPDADTRAGLLNSPRAVVGSEQMQSALLWAAVLWLCPPDAAFAPPPTTFAYGREPTGGLPPPTVFEYIAGRAWDEKLDFSNTGWRTAPAQLPPGLARIRDQARTARNRQIIAEDFAQELAQASLPVAAASTIAIAAGLRPVPVSRGGRFSAEGAGPTLFDAGAALEMQTLLWHSRELHVCFSGRRHAIGDRAMGGASTICRVRASTAQQARVLLDETIAAASSGDSATRLQLQAHAPAHLQGRYEPSEFSPRAGGGTERRGAVPLRLSLPDGKTPRSAPSASWNARDEVWAVTYCNTVTSVPPEDAELHHGEWLLSLCRPVLWHLHNAVLSLPPTTCVAARLAQPGLSSKLVPADPWAWAAFATAADQASFAEHFAPSYAASGAGELLSISGSRGRELRGLSRRARDRDWLFLPSTCFVFVDSTEAEAQEDVIEVREVPMLSALAFRVRAELPTAAPSDLGRLLELASLLEAGAGEQAVNALLKPSSSYAVLLSRAGSLCVAQLAAMGLAQPGAVDAALQAAAGGAWGEAGVSAAVCRLLLRAGANPSSVDRDTGLTAAGVAARALNTEALAALVAAGAPAPTRDHFGHDALHRAGKEGRVDAVPDLIDEWGFSGDASKQDALGRCPLHYAAASPAFASSGAEGALRRLARPSVVNMELPGVRVAQPSNNQAHGGERRSSKPHARRASIAGGQEAGYRALHIAATAGHVAPMGVLLSLGADPNARGYDGNDPLRCACRNLHSEAVETLLRCTDRPIEPDDFPPGALHSACASGDLGTVALLLRLCPTEGLSERDDPRNHAEAPLGCPSGRSSAPVNGRGVIGAMPLHAAAAVAAFDEQPEGAELIRKLCTRLSLKACTPSGHSALHRAAFFGRPRTLRVLLEQGADADQLTDTAPPRTALDIAVAHGFVSCCAVLVPATSGHAASREQLMHIIDWAGEAHPLRNAGEVRRLCSVAAGLQGARFGEETRRRLQWDDTKAAVCGRTAAVHRLWHGVVELDFGGDVGRLCFPVAAVRRGRGDHGSPPPQRPSKAGRRASLPPAAQAAGGASPRRRAAPEAPAPQPEDSSGLWRRSGVRKALTAATRMSESPLQARRQRMSVSQTEDGSPSWQRASTSEQPEEDSAGWYGLLTAEELLRSHDRPSFSSPPSSLSIHSRAPPRRRSSKAR
eukprot:TRINITY_DN65837_c0_g1_i1.p1 TRINITY_DN65837_c0_g1~~TRINITY_DN65837_c0_g1_i1.p1  ORF type:complete len:1556 (+),score=367.57 TRINITY_DN65837_c0_g1_i1:79-4746(+)